MGLHIPGAAFVTPNTPLRRKLTDYAATQIVKNTAQRDNFTPLCEIVTEKVLLTVLLVYWQPVVQPIILCTFLRSLKLQEFR